MRGFKWLKVFLAILFICFLYLDSRAQSWGIPFIKNYSPKDYEGGSDNYSITQDKRGVMYFANGLGIMEYDGVSWNLISVSNESRLRSLDVSKQGILYAGATGDFGYVVPGKKGQWTFQSLLPMLNEEDRQFSDVWKTYATDKGVYFTTFNKIFLYNNNQVKTWNAPSAFHLSFFIKDHLYVMDQESGLNILIGDNLKPVIKSGIFKGERIYAMFSVDDSTSVVASRETGLYLLNTQKAIKGDSLNLVKILKTEANNYLIENQVYHGLKVNDSTYAFATLRGGIVLVGTDGEIKLILGKKNNLQDENVKYLFIDKAGGLWAALDNGVSRIEIQSPLRKFNDLSGLSGSIQSIIRSENILYVATTLGVFYLNEEAGGNPGDRINCFQPVQGIYSQARQLKEVRLNNSKRLLAATKDGVFEIKETKSRLLLDYNSFALTQSQKGPSRIFIATNSGIAAARFSDKKMHDEGWLDGLEVEGSSIIEDEKGNIWLGTDFYGVFQILFKKDGEYKSPWAESYTIQSFDTSKGLPDMRKNVVYRYNSSVLFGTFKGIFELDDNQKKVVIADEFKSFVHQGKRQVMAFTPVDNNNFWLMTSNANIKEAGLLFRENRNDEFKFYSRPFKRFVDSEIHTIYVDDNNYVWFGGPDGLIQYRKEQVQNKLPFNALLRRVVIGKDTVFHGAMNPADFMNEKQRIQIVGPEVDYENNSMTFFFNSTSYDNEIRNQYSWMLDGYDKEWSAWSNESKVSYTNLNEGSYVFMLKSKNAYHDESKVIYYTLTISPPWYRTIYAYIAYFILGVGLIYISVQLSIRRLKKAKVTLEKVVSERTAEVVRQKEEIESQKYLVDQKNKDITDSINYASRIQQAILPLIDDIKRKVPETFILFKPRDIVSGDFYWSYLKNEHVLIAAADCTGHGVPGAFMSMIGHTLLNEIVNEKNITDPAHILTALNEQVRISLKQNSQGDSRDGMDIALCSINTSTRDLTFAGAMRPLYLCRNGKLEEIKADKFPIGGLQDNVKEFSQHTFKLSPGDGFFITSDGYADQFGGPNGKKFMTKKLKDLIETNLSLKMDNLSEVLDNTFENWKHGYEQVDDILIIGMKL